VADRPVRSWPRAHSSRAEQGTHNSEVAGSNPAGPTAFSPVSHPVCSHFCSHSRRRPSDAPGRWRPDGPAGWCPGSGGGGAYPPACSSPPWSRKTMGRGDCAPTRFRALLLAGVSTRRGARVEERKRWASAQRLSYGQPARAFRPSASRSSPPTSIASDCARRRSSAASAMRPFGRSCTEPWVRDCPGQSAVDFNRMPRHSPLLDLKRTSMSKIPWHLARHWDSAWQVGRGSECALTIQRAEGYTTRS
jgi:hypothetical protein